MSNTSKKLNRKVLTMALLAGLSSSAAAQGLTSGSVPCQDVTSNGEAYGCSNEEENAANAKYKCLKKLSFFEVPLSNEDSQNSFDKPGKIKKGDGVTVVGTGADKIAITDANNNFEISKEDIKNEIERQYGSDAQNESDFKVSFQTPSGKKVKLKIKKKPATPPDRGFDLGKWDVVQDSSSGSSEDIKEAVIALSQRSARDVLGVNPNQLKPSLDEKVSNFPNKVQEKISEIEQAYEEKKDRINTQEGLSAQEKIQAKRRLDQEKERKKDYWNRKKDLFAQKKAEARRKCSGQSQLISENTLQDSGSTPQGGGSPARNAASE